MLQQFSDSNGGLRPWTCEEKPATRGAHVSATKPRGKVECAKNMRCNEQDGRTTTGQQRPKEQSSSLNALEQANHHRMFPWNVLDVE